MLILKLTIIFTFVDSLHLELQRAISAHTLWLNTSMKSHISSIMNRYDNVTSHISHVIKMSTDVYDMFPLYLAVANIYFVSYYIIQI